MVDSRQRMFQRRQQLLVQGERGFQTEITDAAQLWHEGAARRSNVARQPLCIRLQRPRRQTVMRDKERETALHADDKFEERFAAAQAGLHVRQDLPAPDRTTAHSLGISAALSATRVRVGRCGLEVSLELLDPVGFALVVRLGVFGNQFDARIVAKAQRVLVLAHQIGELRIARCRDRCMALPATKSTIPRPVPGGRLRAWIFTA